MPCHVGIAIPDRLYCLGSGSGLAGHVDARCLLDQHVLYLTLIALLSLGLAAALRDSAAAIGLVLGVLYLFPIAADLISNPALARHLQQIGPLSAVWTSRPPSA
jgi:hypothetical protein